VTSVPQPSSSVRLFRLAAPVIGINVLNVLVLAVDAALCGRLPDNETTLAGLGFAVQIIFLLMVAMLGLTIGTVALVARAYGAGDHPRVNHVLNQSTQLTAALGVVVAIVGNLLAPLLLRMLGASDAALDVGLDYLRPMLAATPLYYLTLLYGGVLRGVGNTRLPFLIALLANVVNGVLAYGLILGNFGLPQLGALGAGIATPIAYCFNAGLLIYHLRRESVPGLKLALRRQAIDKPLARTLVRIGAPAALDMIILNAAFLSILGMLGRIAETAVAAHGLGLRIQGLAFVPGLAISQATGALVGNALGAKNPDEARSVARASVLLCTAVMSALALILVVFAHPIVDGFDVPRGTELHAYAVEWMRLLGYCMPIAGVHIALVGVLQGAGATWVSLRINAWTSLLFQIPCSWLLGFPLGLGALGVWLAFPLSFALRAGLAAIAYRRGRWARVGVDA
jgi:putative MATE family efflux protein